MQGHRAIIVAEAAGPEEQVASALDRAGFATVVHSPKLDNALARLRVESFDLLVIPLQEIDPLQFLTLEREIRGRTAVSVIGTAPTPDPDLIVRAMRAGMHEFLVSPPSQADLIGAVSRLVNRTGPVRRGQLHAVYSSKGGLGTTSIAVNTAYALAKQEPGSVALADGVFGGGDVRVFLNLRAAYHIGDLADKLGDVDSAMLRSIMTNDPSGLAILPSAEDPIVEETFDGAAVTSIMELLRTNFHTTVVDCEHHLSERTLAILDAADHVILVTQSNVPALRDTQRTLALFRRLGYADDKTKIVVNRFGDGGVFSLDNVVESLQRNVYATLPNDYVTSSAALDKGVSVIQHDSDSKLSRAYELLAEQLHTGSGPSAKRDTSAKRSRLLNLFGRN